MTTLESKQFYFTIISGLPEHTAQNVLQNTKVRNVEVIVRVEPWKTAVDGGWHRLLALLWCKFYALTGNIRDPPDVSHCEVWRILPATNTQSASGDGGAYLGTLEQIYPPKNLNRAGMKTAWIRFTEVGQNSLLVMRVSAPLPLPTPPPLQDAVQWADVRKRTAKCPWAPVRWLKTLSSEATTQEYKSLYTLSSRCPGAVDFNILKYLSKFVSACINTDMDGVIRFGVMEIGKRDELVKHVDAAVVDKSGWPKVVGFEWDVEKPDEHVRQIILDKELLGMNQYSNTSLLTEEKCTIQPSKRKAAKSKKKRNDQATWSRVSFKNLDRTLPRLRPFLRPVVDDNGKPLTPTRWLLDIYVDGGMKQVIERGPGDQSPEYNPVTFVSRFRNFEEKNDLDLGDMLSNAAVSAIEAKAATLKVDSIVIHCWKQFWAGICSTVLKASTIDVNSCKIGTLTLEDVFTNSFSSLQMFDVVVGRMLPESIKELRKFCTHFVEAVENECNRECNKDATVHTLRQAYNGNKCEYTQRCLLTQQEVFKKDFHTNFTRPLKMHLRLYSSSLAAHPSTWIWQHEYRLSTDSHASLRTQHGSNKSMEPSEMEDRRKVIEGNLRGLNTHKSKAAKDSTPPPNPPAAREIEYAPDDVLAVNTRVKGVVDYTITPCSDNKHFTGTWNSRVYRAMCNQKQQGGKNGVAHYALKQVGRERNLLREASTYFELDPKTLANNHVMVLRDVACVNNIQLLVTDWAENNTMYEWIQGRKVVFDQNVNLTAVKYVIQAAIGLHALHTLAPPRIHQDIKPSNLMIFANDVVEVGDFGLMTADADVDGASGTAGYMAPEQVGLNAIQRARDRGVDEDTIADAKQRMKLPDSLDTSCDVWGLALVLAEALTGPISATLKFRNWFTVQITANDTLTHRIETVRLMASKISTDIEKLKPQSLKLLLQACFQHDPCQRPTAQDFMNNLYAWCETVGTTFIAPKREQVVERNVFESFKYPREREAWYTSTVLRDIGCARRLLEDELDAQIEGWRQKTLNISTALPLLPLLMDWVVTIASSSAGDCGADHSQLVELGSDLLIALQGAWFEKEETCCNRCFHSTHDFFSPVMRVVEKVDTGLNLAVSILEPCLAKSKNFVNHQTTDDKKSPLFIAAREGSSVAVDLLLQNNADMSVSINSGSTPMHVAARNGHIDVVKLLIKSNANINDQRKTDGWTPLHCAVSPQSAAARGATAIVTKLIDLNADPNVTTHRTESVISLAVDSINSSIDVVDELLRCNVDVDGGLAASTTPLFRATEIQHIAIVKLLLEANANVDRCRTTDPKETPLIMAVACGHYDIAKLLLRVNADVNRPRGDGVTPLMFAADRGSMQLVQLLVRADAHISEDAIKLARAKNHSEVAVFLVSNFS